MEILNLINLPSAGAKKDFGGKAPPKLEFEPKSPGAKAQAPPGPEPPPKAIDEPLGEEGAIREPIAPTQDLDFSPQPPPKTNSDGLATPNFDLAKALTSDEGEVNQLPKELVHGLVLAAVASMGPIVVPMKDSPPEISEVAIPLSATAAETPSPRSTPTLEWVNQAPELTPTGQGPDKRIADECPASDPPRRGDVQQPAPESSDRMLNRGVPTKDAPPPSGDTTQTPNSNRRDRKIGDEPEVVKVEVRPEKERPSNLTESVKTAEAAAKLKHSVQPEESKPEGKLDAPDPAGETAGRPVPTKPSEHGPFREESKDPGKWRQSDAQIQPKSGGKEPAAGPLRVEHGGSERAKRSIPSLEIDPKLDLTSLKPVSESPNPGTVLTPVKPALEAATPVKATPELALAQRESVIRQVIDRVESLAAGARQNVTIHLDPKDFGSITLVVKRSGTEVEAEFYASHDAVRQALETNKNGLQSSLEQRGVQLSSMTVGSELPNSSGRQEQASKEAAQQAQRQFTPRSERNEVPTYSLDAMRNLTRRASGVDLWI